MSTQGPAPDERLASVIAQLDVLTNWERRARSAGAMRLSLDPERDLLERLGRPQTRLRVVHVTGTKGKGSTSALIAAGLTRAGLATVLYTSPHLVRIHERLRFDGREVESATLAEGLERAFDARREATSERTAGAEATWFDVLTAAALWVAGRSSAQWLVAEVGLGGRLDSTNVLAGEVCVITSIELEHTAVLGSTREAIAGEKAGILKRGATLVSGLDSEDAAGRVIEARARELDVPVVRPELRGLTIPGRNLALARAALDALGVRGVRAANGTVISGLLLDAATAAGAALPGRLEHFRIGNTRVVLDGGHVAESVRDVLAGLREEPGFAGRCVAVVGMARDKDLAGILKALARAADRVFCTSVGSELHFTPEEIAGVAQRLGLAAETAVEPRMALDRALDFARRAGAEVWVLIIGSLYLAGAVRPALVRASSKRPC